MAFRVSARTVLELGAELISSDAIAIYELVKNAIDAESEDGIDICFFVTLTHAHFIESLAEIQEASLSVDQLRAKVLARTQRTATPEMIRTLREALEATRSHKALEVALRSAYAETSWIEFRDTGKGMSKDDLLERYLVIGTPSRKRAIDEAEAQQQKNNARKPQAPYLGEKGVGRLSVMRLGTLLHVETATAREKRLNVLDVDWSQFDDLSLDVGDIDIQPTQGGEKAKSDWSGTTIRVANLTGRWSLQRVSDLARYELARLIDPFSRKRHFRIALYFNDDRIAIPRLEDALLKAAHASVKASYEPDLTNPKLSVEMAFTDSQGRVQTKALTLQRPDIVSILNDPDEAIPQTTLKTVGPFEMEAYWYNRRLLAAVESIGDRTAVRELQRRWSGIMMFRGEYRVSPYGNDDDDWLGLDRRALASPGYKLNKSQFLGRVRISRLLNPRLQDQTNREGLQDCPEKFLLVELLRWVLQGLLRDFMDDVEKQQRKVEKDLPQLEDRITHLEKRAKEAVQKLTSKHKESSVELKDILALFKEMRGYFDEARELAEQAEDERTRLIQLAGVGLMLEVVAHELARATEHAMGVLAETESGGLPDNLAATLRTLRREMQTMNKRLRVLDPLSVSARQRKETFDLVELIRDSVAGHSAQFERHHVVVDIVARRPGSLSVTGVRGMYVQIIENLISNSVFWLTARQADEKTFQPKITIMIEPSKRVVRFADNGPGIALSLKDDVFKPFFSTKDRKRRQGLGLYIARECATFNDAEIYLSDERSEHKDRLNTFILEVKTGGDDR